MDGRLRNKSRTVPLTSGGEMVYARDKIGKKLNVAGTTVPTDALAGYATGCIFSQTDGGVGTAFYVNEGTAASCDFNAVPSLGAAMTLAGALTFSSTVAVSTADALTVGGIIVPQGMPLVNETISLHASKVTFNLFVAREAVEITHIDYVPDIAQGGALTSTVVKCTGTATPASATTPMHTANAINLNGTAHTVQPITLSATVADLRLAAGERIGLVHSGAMTVGSGHLSIRGKRI